MNAIDKPDYSKYTTKQLELMLQTIPGELKARKDALREETFAAMKRVAEEKGFSIDDFLGTKTDGSTTAKRKSKRSSSASEGKYRHPDNADMSWTGHGRKPNWLIAWLEGGGTLEQLLCVSSSGNSQVNADSPNPA